MAGQDIEDWLSDWAEENIQTPGYYEDKAAMRADAAQCRGDARAAGYSEAALLKAASGDLEAYLLREQNAFTDSEVRRKADKDD